MNGPDLARDLLTLAARSSILSPPDEVTDAHAGWPVEQEGWRRLSGLVDAHSRQGGDRLWEHAESLGMSWAGRWLLFLAAAVELYPDAAAAASIVAEDERVHLITPSTYARIVCAASQMGYIEALVEAIPGCPAERYGLIERAPTVGGRPLSQQPLLLSASGMAILLGAELVSTPADAMTHTEPPAPGTAYDRELPTAVSAILDAEGIVCLSSSSRRAARQLALDVASVRGQATIIVTSQAYGVPEPARVSSLRGGLVVLDMHPYTDTDGQLEALLRRLSADVPTMVAVVPENAPTGTLATIDVERIGFAERRRIWAMVVDEKTATSLADRFAVDALEARNVVRAAARSTRSEAQPDVGAISAALCADGARRMGRSVSRLTPRVGLDDLVASDGLRDHLRDILASYRTQATVYGSWQMGHDSDLGRGLTCLFTGPPGTGKTFAAQCLAHDLGLNLYRIDLSRVVSKYIGETEKVLANIFDEAESGHGILLFDEADALFGKRSQVKDAHDRYANIEVDFLLQRMEAFEGISILTTNLQENLDKAFYRRLSFVVHFPMPDLPMRRRLWERFLPPLERRPEDLDVEPFVERFVLAGGNIRNIGIAAAHMAAESEDQQLSNDHLLRATFRELEKAGLSRSREDFSRLATVAGGKN